ncbi:MAG: helix-hairpin-helix domain-containing protein [Acutalibacteraceae bacterium]
MCPARKASSLTCAPGRSSGIGPKTAEKIYAMFGQNTLTVLDHEPEQLLAVPGISKTKLKKI